VRWLIVLLLSLTLVTPVGAHPVPNKWLTQGYRCFQVDTKFLTVNYCWSPATSMPDTSLMQSLQAFMSAQYGITKKMETTVYIESTVISTKYKGAYFPTGGFIIVTDDQDDIMEAYVIAHELLHFIWHDRGIEFGEHHRRIYCDDEMAPVVSLLMAKDPQKKHRVWISPLTKTLKCTEWQ